MAYLGASDSKISHEVTVHLSAEAPFVSKHNKGWRICSQAHPCGPPSTGLPYDMVFGVPQQKGSKRYTLVRSHSLFLSLTNDL